MVIYMEKTERLSFSMVDRAKDEFLLRLRRKEGTYEKMDNGRGEPLVPQRLCGR